MVGNLTNAVTGTQYAEQACSEKYTGVPYSKLDCQSFVEQVLKDCGVRRKDGSAYNWKGSNDMWRHALSWRGKIDDCLKQFGEIPLGSWVFIVKNDGGEVERGYHDNDGNASHVGIYCRRGDTPVRDSTRTKTRDGVGYRALTGFTHVGLPSMIDYNIHSNGNDAVHAISVIRNPSATDADILSALAVLTKYLRGV